MKLNNKIIVVHNYNFLQITLTFQILLVNFIMGFGLFASDEDEFKTPIPASVST